MSGETFLPFRRPGGHPSTVGGEGDKSTRTGSLSQLTHLTQTGRGRRPSYPRRFFYRRSTVCTSGSDGDVTPLTRWWVVVKTLTTKNTLRHCPVFESPLISFYGRVDITYDITQWVWDDVITSEEGGSRRLSENRLPWVNSPEKPSTEPYRFRPL